MTRIALILVLLAPTLALANDAAFTIEPGIEGIADTQEVEGIHCGDVQGDDAMPFDARGDTFDEPLGCTPPEDGHAEGMVDDGTVDWAMAW